MGLRKPRELHLPVFGGYCIWRVDLPTLSAAGAAEVAVTVYGGN